MAYVILAKMPYISKNKYLSKQLDKHILKYKYLKK